ncbi:WYL domain-containing protein [Pseudomonas sp. A-1]|uniref:helix-turn-helix transcriptional regulator n=1 Tax=Pseudomonas sp. A-1 TaxID=1821274 RepID=UPI0010A67443|nr:WYL domain-containing protein [Pseudomonas sp. A-1]THG82324.1 WYL domain-containing protein [Pseudomonas sp. A-1]
MSATATRNTISRQWELLRSLPARPPGITAQELVDLLDNAGFTVSKRTIERDLIELSNLFPLQCNDKSAPYGWYWTPGATAELPGLTLSEALTLRLVEDSLRPLLPAYLLKSLEPRFAQAHQKLLALGDQVPAARWIDKIASVPPELALLAPEINGELLERIQQALLEDRQLDCSYFAAHRNKVTELRLNPLALIQRGNITYLAAIAEPYEDVRLYAAHRFQQVDLLDVPCRRPDDFSLDEYIASGALQFTSPGAGMMKLQAWISLELARQLRETPLTDDMRLEIDGDGYRLSATLQDSWQLRWWLLSHAGKMVVHEPLALRQELLSQLETSLRQYRDAMAPDADAPTQASPCCSSSA